jgi:hypothetical protein
MRIKRNPHRPYASGDTRKEELTKRLCSLVDNSQDSCKKVPSAKNAPTEQSSERPVGAKGKGKSMGIKREKRERREREWQGQRVANRELEKLNEWRGVE